MERKNMTGIYLSGTGNTEHYIQKLPHLLDKTAQAVPMEQKDAVHLLSQHDIIVFAYPVQFSSIPAMVRDLIQSNRNLWKNKKVLCVATMGLFSGDGAGCSARLLKKYGAEILGGFHIRMPDSVCDVSLLKRSPEKNREIIQAAAKKHCTMCYRCISLCPAKAITLLGRTVIEQCRYDKYVKRR